MREGRRTIISIIRFGTVGMFAIRVHVEVNSLKRPELLAVRKGVPDLLRTFFTSVD